MVIKNSFQFFAITYKFKLSVNINSILLIGIIMIFGSCNLSKPSTFGNMIQQKKNYNSVENIYRIYFDGEGSLYPPANLIKVDDKNLAGDCEGFLNQYFYYRPKDTVIANLRLNEYKKLLLHYNQNSKKTITLNFKTWSNLQRAMREEVSQDLKAIIKNKQITNIIFLIHGFNAPDPTKSYIKAKEIIYTKYYTKNKKPLIVEIYWDGWAGIPSNNMWKNSQANAYQVGMALRPILHSLPDDIAIRILTHSTGGPLICAALWNNYEKLIKPYPRIWEKGWDYVTDDPIDYPTPVFSNLRVGMVVPAMPALTFYDYGNRVPTSNLVGCKERFIIGQNKKDYATRKFSISSSKFGSTTLAVFEDEFNTAKVYLDKYSLKQNLPDGTLGKPNSEIFRVDFANKNNKKTLLFWDDHSFYQYLIRENSNKFFDLLFLP